MASINKWDDYSKARDVMFEHTDTENSPWYIVKTDIKKHARINCISHLLSCFDYGNTTYEKKDMPAAKKSGYKGEYTQKRYVDDIASKLMNER